MTNAKRSAQHSLNLIASRNYRLSRRLGLRRLRSASSRSVGSPIVVHQMGKVGSTSVTRAIQTVLPDTPVYQVHHLSAAALSAEEAAYRDLFATRHKLDGHLLNALFVQSKIDAGTLPADTRVVSAVRDPITQRLSAYFQTLPFRMPDLAARHRTEGPDQLAEAIIDDFRQPGRWWHANQIDRFLDDELRTVWGFNALAHEFDRERGALTGFGTDHQCLIVRFEDFAELAPVALAAFLGVAALEFPMRQTSESKFYADLVRNVRSRLRLDPSYLDEAYGSSGARHFYDQREIELARARWSSSSAS